MTHLSDALSKAKMQMHLCKKQGRMDEASCWESTVAFLRREVQLVSGMECRKERLGGPIQESSSDYGKDAVD
jgi:hypothetical protein